VPSTSFLCVIAIFLPRDNCVSAELAILLHIFDGTLGRLVAGHGHSWLLALKYFSILLSNLLLS